MVRSLDGGAISGIIGKKCVGIFNRHHGVGQGGGHIHRRCRAGRYMQSVGALETGTLEALLGYVAVSGLDCIVADGEFRFLVETVERAPGLAVCVVALCQFDTESIGIGNDGAFCVVGTRTVTHQTTVGLQVEHDASRLVRSAPGTLVTATGQAKTRHKRQQE